MTDRTKIEAAGFEAWQDVHSSEFQLLMAFKYGAPDSLERARHYLRAALSHLDAALADQPATETEGTPV